MIRIKRVYEAPAEADGYRVLVDKLWPRGLSKGDAKLDRWMKELAPSDPLRVWFGHDPQRWTEFRERYRLELEEKGEAITFLLDKARAGTVTLLYAAKDTEHNNAVALKLLLAKVLEE